MKLSILICTVDTRTDKVSKLINELTNPNIELIWLGDNQKMTIGQKRNWLLWMATGDYVAFIDDDDSIEPNYIKELLNGCNSGVDVVCFDVMYNSDSGVNMPVYYSVMFQNENNKDHFKRTPNHLMCFKRSIAKEVLFRPVNFGEDNDFAERIKPLIKTEHQINKVLYNYQYSFENSESEKRQRNG